MKNKEIIKGFLECAKHDLTVAQSQLDDDVVLYGKIDDVIHYISDILEDLK